ncbi:MAG: hypothetical protein SFW36_12125 [Leptolyngbyaceae cyanobacterium bins.59]|nr:hypothetical protein [Leptolyngbyaceae cyanobacterium bins.59]
MPHPLRILLQTTIPPTDDDWSIARFSYLRDYLASLTDKTGNPLYEVTARDREPDSDGNDPILSTLGDSHYDELWLFAVDVGDGLSPQDLQGITAFHQRGGGILATRDHHDLGCSLCSLGIIGSAHHFHTHNPEPDTARHQIDDINTTTILWPNYHSGRNGDYQTITPIAPIHNLLKNPTSPTGVIQFFPAHPHEGAVSVPPKAEKAQVIATGKSMISGRVFNLAIAFDRQLDTEGHLLGRAVAESTFHHFCDYNWDARAGCPSFVTEPAGDTMQTEPQAIEDLQAYLRNLAAWLAPA